MGHLHLKLKLCVFKVNSKSFLPEEVFFIACFISPGLLGLGLKECCGIIYISFSVSLMVENKNITPNAIICNSPHSKRKMIRRLYQLVKWADVINWLSNAARLYYGLSG